MILGNEEEEFFQSIASYSTKITNEDELYFEILELLSGCCDLRSHEGYVFLLCIELQCCQLP